MPHEIATVLRCKLCPPSRQKMIAGPSLVLGPGAPTNRVGEFVKSLTDHIATEHPQTHEFLQQKMLEFFGLQCLMQYSTADDGIKYSRNILRWNIHQATLDVRIPDDKLETKSAEFARTIVEMVVDQLGIVQTTPYDLAPILDSVTEKVTEVFRGIRDVLQEPNPPARPSSLNGRL